MPDDRPRELPADMAEQFEPEPEREIPILAVLPLILWLILCVIALSVRHALRLWNYDDDNHNPATRRESRYLPGWVQERDEQGRWRNVR